MNRDDRIEALIRATLAEMIDPDQARADWEARGRPVAPFKIICRVCNAWPGYGADLKRVSTGVYECRAGHKAA
jgi:hypothetical protein